METAASAVLLGALASAEISEGEKELIAEIAPAGLTLFARNISQSNHHQLKILCQEIQRLRAPAAPPFLIAIDQEGGRVARLKSPFPDEGPALCLAGGRSDVAALAHLSAYGTQVGRALRDLGVNVNFAPVLDIFQETTHVSIGDRAFGRNPQEVSLRAGSFLDGMQKANVAGCLKHFPGQGSAQADTHFHSVRVEKSLAELKNWDFLPFEALIHKAPMVMLSHCIYSCLEEKEASISSMLIEDLLRKHFGFKGVAVSDDMTMAAVFRQGINFGDTVVTAVESGIDLVLICKGLDLWWEAYHALKQHEKESPAFKRRLLQAAERVNTLRAQLR